MSSSVFSVSTRVWQLAAINLATLGLIALGLGIFGLAPALVACLWATDRLDGRTAGELVAGMWREYRREFGRANLIALPAALGALACLIVGAWAGSLALAILLPLGILAAGFAIAALVVLSRFETNLREAWGNAQTAFALAPWRHLAGLALVPLAAWAAWEQPLLGLYFGLSAPCLALNFVVAPALACATPNLREITS